jgi:hypothetical protein
MTNRLVPPPITPILAEHLGRLSRSFAHWTGRDLLGERRVSVGLAERLFEAPFVLLSHGTEPDPILNYGNRMALTLWETTWDRFTRTPSRLTAEEPLRDARARVLTEVARRGYADDYQGVRVSFAGRRFLIERAVVWTIVDADGKSHGQAAMFEEWTYLD